MCGRFVLATSERKLRKRFRANSGDQLGFKENFNIAPTQKTPIVLRRSPNRLEWAKFGMIPYWEKQPTSSFSTINARAETIFQKPLFRKSILFNRCLVPTTGFIEWHRFQGEKQPYVIERSDGEPFALAGIWSEWGEEEKIVSFSILTVASGSFMSSLHNREPLVLSKEDEDKWLDQELKNAKLVANFFNTVAYDKNMEMHPISKRINNVRNNDVHVIDRVRPKFTL
jgi:putative SOS response-associated peptidase YedK